MGEAHDQSELLGAARTLLVDVTAAEAVATLATAGVQCLLLRGPALAILLYDDIAQRSYMDVDLLVDPDRLIDAEAALQRAGFSESPLEAAFPNARPLHAHTWWSSVGVAVDLHRSLIGVGAPAEAAWRVLSGRSETLTIQGCETKIPFVGARAMIVALHAAHHVDDLGSALDDLERALDRLPAQIWSEAARLARSLNADEGLAAGLGLSSRGREMLLRLGFSSTEGDWSREARGERAFHVAQGIAWVRSTPGVRPKARVLRSRLLPSARSMRRRSSLARRGAPGLALAYVARVVDAARHLPEALGALRRLRR